jgi:hypothetical protein
MSHPVDSLRLHSYAEDMDCYRVSKLVNNARNDSPTQRSRNNNNRDGILLVLRATTGWLFSTNAPQLLWRWTGLERRAIEPH